MAGLFLGVIDIGIVVALLLLLGLLTVLVAGMFSISFPPEMRKIYLVLVLLVALYMLVALIFGIPSFSVLPRRYAL